MVNLLNLPLLICAFIGLISIFFINFWLGVKHGFGFRHYWFFELLHFLGGFFVAMFLFGIYPSRRFIYFGLTAITFLWELTEYIISKTPKYTRFFKQKLGAKDTKVNPWDTVLDVILNFVGATLFWYLFS